jgi:hypothetical protein
MGETALRSMQNDVEALSKILALFVAQMADDSRADHDSGAGGAASARVIPAERLVEVGFAGLAADPRSATFRTCCRRFHDIDSCVPSVQGRNLAGAILPHFCAKCIMR